MKEQSNQSSQHLFANKAATGHYPIKAQQPFQEYGHYLK
jgi:hypothetical protein